MSCCWPETGCRSIFLSFDRSSYELCVYSTMREWWNCLPFIDAMPSFACSLVVGLELFARRLQRSCNFVWIAVRVSVRLAHGPVFTPISFCERHIANPEHSFIQK
ncbi:hypothetical protein Y032_0320g2401 [Ancylostoma ceylanicum]|uniref:Uncharacterized protein n=1 Tax=Ancylostoma ceylanicum TaxID=53326 RepID=A0A016S201_9BILA|nr:hypothetical protein Y032_0320g2401 [Ancylostoma ceylanicum]